MVESKDYKNIAFACAIVAFSFTIAAMSTPDTISQEMFPGSIMKWGVWRQESSLGVTTEIKCSDILQFGNSSECEQQCGTMQAFSIIAVIFIFFSVVIAMSEDTKMIRIAGFSAVIASISLLIVWALVAAQFDREWKITNDDNQCSYKDEPSAIDGVIMPAKLMWGFAFYVVACILSAFQAACLFYAVEY